MEKCQVLRWMIMLMIVCNSLVTISINVAITTMTQPSQETQVDSNKTIEPLCPNMTFSWGQTDGESNVTLHQEDTYVWSIYEKQMVLSAYHWLSWLSILPGSVLSQKYGSKVVVGSMLCTSTVLSSAIPFAAEYGANFVMYVRMLQGCFSFMAAPAGVNTIIGNWSSRGDRGRFYSMILVGSTLGIGVGSFVFGYIGKYLHWKYIFYLTSVNGIIWSVLWYFLIHDYPSHHPTISDKEKNKILKSRTHPDNEESIPIPWREIFTSIPATICSLNYAITMTNFFVCVTFIPLYFQDMYGIDSSKVGLLICLCELICAFCTVSFGYITDYFIKKEWWSSTFTRKLSHSFCISFLSLPLVGMALIKCNLIIIIILYIIWTVAKSLIMVGIVPATVDLSPKFCGILEGIMATATEIITALFSSGLTYFSKNLSVDEYWKVVFLTISTMGLVSFITFTIWGTAEIQPWNQGSKKYQQKKKREYNISSLDLMNTTGQISIA